MDAEDRVGEAAVLFLTTPQASLTINQNNLESVLEFLVSVANEELFSDFIQTAKTAALISSAPDAHTPRGFELLASRELDMGQAYQYDYRCISNDGTLVKTRSGGIQQNYQQMKFNDCKSLLLDGQQLDGRFSRSWTLIKEAYNPGGDVGYSFDITITTVDRRNRALAGGLSLRSGLLSTLKWSDNGTEYDAEAFEGATSVTDFMLTRKSGATKAPDADPWVNSLQTSFSVQAPQTGNKPIRVDTLEPFVGYLYDGCFESGILKATGADGSWLEVDANTGDINTYELTIGTGEYSTNSVATWSPKTILKPLPTDESTAPPTIASQCAGLYLEHYR